MRGSISAKVSSPVMLNALRRVRPAARQHQEPRITAAVGGCEDSACQYRGAESTPLPTSTLLKPSRLAPVWVRIHHQISGE